MLVALDEAGERVMAAVAHRESKHRCPECKSDVRLKQGPVRIPHFAHLPGADYCPNTGESELHLQMKMYFWNAYNGLPWVARCDPEVPVGRRRADLLVEDSTGARIALECQTSRCDSGEVESKFRDYGTAGIYTIYVVHANIFRAFKAEQGVGSLHLRQVTVPEWARTVAWRFLMGQEEWTALHLYDDWGVWLVGLQPILRPKARRGKSGHWTYGPGPATKPLVTRSKLHLLRQIPVGDQFRFEDVPWARFTGSTILKAGSANVGVDEAIERAGPQPLW